MEPSLPTELLPDMARPSILSDYASDHNSVTEEV